MAEGRVSKTLPVLIAAAECAPLAKSGGLADVVGALPRYLAAEGVDARVIMPFHSVVKAAWRSRARHVCDFWVDLGWRHQYVGIEHARVDGVDFYFVDNELYFGGPIYCGGEFEGEQYAFFTRAVLEALPLIAEIDGFTPRVLHCNDWHTGMIPMLARTQYRDRAQGSLKFLLTIHNLAYQGRFSHEFMREMLGVDDWLATPEFMEFYGCDNMLKAGILFSDRVNTVSPTYAAEITTPAFGEGLDGVLRTLGDRLTGILNGIDARVWDPASDADLAANYDRGDLAGKSACKWSLLDELGLASDRDRPVVGMVGRLTPQKGVDLVLECVDGIVGDDATLVVLGSGDARLEDALRRAEAAHPGRVCAYIGFNAGLSRRIYAGSDLFLMPSAFEPCGISQLIAMRYGTLPVVRKTGGLNDTVVPFNRFTGEGTGFSFANYDARELAACLSFALGSWRDDAVRSRLIAQAMACDFGFERCARSYADLYKTL